MPQPTRTALVRLFEEAKAVLETQVETLQALDEKSAQLVRFNLLVSGLAVTAVSILLRQAVPTGPRTRFALVPLTDGLVLLAVSTALALLAHRAEAYRIGLRSEGLVDALGFDTDEKMFLAAAIRSYNEGIAENRRVRDSSVARLQWASWILPASIVCLSVASIGLISWGVP